METPPILENRTKKRVSRGRRSSILMKPDDASPTVISAPINDSIQGKTAKEQTAEIKARLNMLAEYKAKLEQEKEEWHAVVTKYKERQAAMETYSKEKNMKKIEAKVSKLLDDVGQRPEHVLTRIFNKFQESMESNAEKMRKEVAKLRIDCLNELQSIECGEKRKEIFNRIIQERSEEDFAKKVDLWTEARAFNRKNIAETTKFMDAREQL